MTEEHIQIINSPINFDHTDDADKVVIRWSWLDVQSLRPDMTKKQALKMLDQVAKRLEERSIELGWEVMETLIQMEE